MNYIAKWVATTHENRPLRTFVPLLKSAADHTFTPQRQCKWPIPVEDVPTLPLVTIKETPDSSGQEGLADPARIETEVLLAMEVNRCKLIGPY